MKYRFAALCLVALLPLSCARHAVQRAGSEACTALADLSDRINERLASDLPFLIQQRMAFADPEATVSLSRIVLAGKRSYGAATRVVSDELLPVSWSMLRNSRFLSGESASLEVPPDVWTSTGALSGAKIPETVFGLVDLLKSTCKTIGFDRSNQTFSFKPPEKTLGLMELNLKIENGKEAEELWQRLGKVIACKDLTRKEECAPIDLHS
jgi:hypothetical protein